MFRDDGGEGPSLGPVLIHGEEEVSQRERKRLREEIQQLRATCQDQGRELSRLRCLTTEAVGSLADIAAHWHLGWPRRIADGGRLRRAGRKEEVMR